MSSETKETIEIYKATILDMNECQLRFALLMILNGSDLPYAIDQSIVIEKRITT